MATGSRFLSLCRVRMRIPLMVFGFIALVVSGCEKYEIGAYSLSSYEGGWKGAVIIDSDLDPHGVFWDIMTFGSDEPYARADLSRRYKDSQVHIKTVLPIPGDDLKGWDEFDLVFFYGHNNMIVPPHKNTYFGCYVYDGSSWIYYYEPMVDLDWGHTTPYCYFTDPLCITRGDTHPGSVTYLYHRYTSCLLGGSYHYDGSGTNWRMRWNDPVEFVEYGKLGTDDLEWLILNGCQAVIVANVDGSQYHPMGLKCFAGTHGKWHIILGHYRSYTTNHLKNLGTFACDLLAGVPVQAAYFDLDPTNNSSAIAAEEFPFQGWHVSTMQKDKWTDRVSDIEDARMYTVRWVRQEGTLAQDWKWDPIAMRGAE